jgi:hypothetical protein
MTHTEIRNHLSVACLRLREAGVPPAVLRPRDLVAFEPEQWGLMIKLARFAEEAHSAEAAANPVRRFREAYAQHPLSVWP